MKNGLISLLNGPGMKSEGNSNGKIDLENYERKTNNFKTEQRNTVSPPACTSYKTNA